MLKRFTSHTLMALAEASLIALLVVGLIAGTAFAGKGGGKPGGGGKPSGGSGTVTWYMMDGGDTTANYEERIAFNVQTTATDRPFVGLRCFQGTDFVLDGYTGYFPQYIYDPWITLGSPYWDASLPADCTARLFYYNSRGGQVVLAMTSFVAQP
jgi:hypothetical protein